MHIIGIAIKHKYDDEMKASIENALGTQKIFDVVHYYYVFTESVGYTSLFFRGKNAVSDDYVKILTSGYKTVGFRFYINNMTVELDFLKEGKPVFKYRSVPPIGKDFGSEYDVKIEGDPSNLQLFTDKNINKEKLQKVLKGKSKLYYPHSHCMSILEELGLLALKHLVFWDYYNLQHFVKRDEDAKKMVDMGEFDNIHKVTIYPSY